MLVNQGTASASNIGGSYKITAPERWLVQPHLVSLVQNSFRLKDGSVVKVTIAEYCSKRASIHGTGLEPDIIIGRRRTAAKALELAGLKSIRLCSLMLLLYEGAMQVGLCLNSLFRFCVRIRGYSLIWL